MKKILFFTLLLSAVQSFSQTHPYSICNTDGHKKLEYYSRQSGIERHFAGLYVQAEMVLEEALKKSDSAFASFVHRFSENFTDKYIAACECFQKNDSIPLVWQTYFSDTNANPYALWVMGINAHINGDMPMVLGTKFSKDELKQYRKHFLAWNSTFDNYTEQVLNDAIQHQGKLKKLHRRSLGLDEWYARNLIHQWRRKAYKTAIRCNGNEQKILKKTSRRCHRTDKKIQRLSRKYLQ